MAFVNPHYSLSFVGNSWRSATCPSHRKKYTAGMSIDSPDIPDVLKNILERKKTEVDELKAQISDQGVDHPISKTMKAKGSIQRSKSFFDSINLPPGSLTVIAEIKRRSPSKGLIGVISDPGNLSRIYHEAGAAAVSVLTDFEGFGGSMRDLRAVVSSQKAYRGDYPGPCPVLRKEFIIDEVQIAEAAEAGASAVLLIVSALGKKRTSELLNLTHAYGLDALVEVHDEEELNIALEAGAEIVGVNNRNLRTFEVSLENSFNLVSKIPKGVIKVAESGIVDCVDAWKLRDAGFNAILVGETLVKAAENSSNNSNSYSVGYNQAKGFIKAYCSKGSVKFGHAGMASFFGKGEGAKESLGELSM